MRSTVPLKLLVKKLLISNPTIAARLVHGMYHKHIRADLDYLRGDGRASHPPCMISLRITNACNHRCAVCGQYGTHGYMKKDSSKELLRTLPVERYKKLIDEVAFSKPILYVTGGEPFLYPGLMELMRYAKKKGLIRSVVTNGSMLKEKAEEIVRDGWEMVIVSFDGPEKVHDRCRGVAGAFRRSFEGLLELQKQKKAKHSTLPLVFTSTTLSEVNAPFLTECFEIGKTIKPDLMVLYLSWFTNEGLGKAQSRILKEELATRAFTWKSYSKTFSQDEARLFSQAIHAIKGRKWPFDYMIIPEVGERNYERYFLHPQHLFGYSKCVAPFIMADVMPNGDVTTCRDYIDVRAGNITESKLLDIWNGPEFIRFRKVLIKHKGLLPQCTRCCGLMGF